MEGNFRPELIFALHQLGAPKAITAAAHKLARIFYNMIKNRQSFMEAGQDEYERQYKERFMTNLTRRALEMGYIYPFQFNRVQKD